MYASRNELHLDTDSHDQLETKLYDTFFIHHLSTGVYQEYLQTFPTLIFLLLVVELSNLCCIPNLDLYMFLI